MWDSEIARRRRATRKEERHDMKAGRLLTTLGLASTLAISAPVFGTEARAQDRVAGTADPTATVYVANNHSLDIRVYAVSGGRRERLGNITSFNSRTFTLPKWFLNTGHDFRLVAYPIGARTSVATHELYAYPGDVVEWQVRHNLRLSSVFVYRAAG
jgi:hypothetical protein